MTINGEVPSFDPSTGGYAFHYMKSNSEVTFGYTTTATETLSTDWVMSGPTDWAGASMASGTDHTDVMSPTVNFCKVDLHLQPDVYKVQPGKLLSSCTMQQGTLEQSQSQS